MHYLYDFSLNFFMDIFNEILNKNEGLNAISKTDLPQRRKVIFDDLFVRAFQKVTNSLLDSDRIVFALRLTQVKLGKAFQNGFLNLVRTPKTIETTLSESLLNGKLTKNQLKVIEDLATNTTEFSGLLADISRNEDKWIDFLSADTPEGIIPTDWVRGGEPSSTTQEDRDIEGLLRDSLIVKAFRPDRFMVIARKLVGRVMGSRFLEEI